MHHSNWSLGYSKHCKYWKWLPNAFGKKIVSINGILGTTVYECDNRMNQRCLFISLSKSLYINWFTVDVLSYSYGVSLQICQRTLARVFSSLFCILWYLILKSMLKQLFAESEVNSEYSPRRRVGERSPNIHFANNCLREFDNAVLCRHHNGDYFIY